MSLQLSRDQRIVLALYEVDGKEPSDLARIVGDTETKARVHSLPTILLRHGVMLTLEYLDAKAADEKGQKKPNLGQVLRKGLCAALPAQANGLAAWPSTRDLAQLPLSHYVAVQDATIAVAMWLKRLVDAHEARSSLVPAREKTLTEGNKK